MNHSDDRKLGQRDGGVNASVIKNVFDGGALGRGACTLEPLGKGGYGARARAGKETLGKMQSQQGETSVIQNDAKSHTGKVKRTVKFSSDAASHLRLT